VKRFRFKSSCSSELRDSKFVFLQFDTAVLPGEVKIGYLFFRVKQDVPRPLLCFKSVTAMGMSLATVEGNCAAQFAVANISMESAALLLRNVPTVEAVTPRMIKSARDTNGKLKSFILKTEAKLSYADACKAHRIARTPPVPNMVSQSGFPPVPKKTGVDRTHERPIVGAAPFPHAAGVPPHQDEMIITEQLDFSSLLFGNPVTFLAFLAEAIRQTMLAKDNNERIDVCQIITKAAGDRMGIPVDADQLQLLSS